MKMYRVLLLVALGLFGLFVPPAHAAQDSNTTIQDRDYPVWLDSWVGYAFASANGGEYRCSYTSNDIAKFKFSGTAITWITSKGLFDGIAEVLVDGASKGTFDLYAANEQYQISIPFQGLASGNHTIVVKNTGNKNPASKGHYVCIDAFSVGGTKTQESSTKIKYNSWNGVSNSNASGGTYRISSSAYATSDLIFTGTSVRWITAMGPSYGKAEVRIDGVSKGVVDLYAPTQQWRVSKSYSGLTNDQHDLSIEVLGKKKAASTGKDVVIDAYKVP